MPLVRQLSAHQVEFANLMDKKDSKWSGAPTIHSKGRFLMKKIFYFVTIIISLTSTTLAEKISGSMNESKLINPSVHTQTSGENKIVPLIDILENARSRETMEILFFSDEHGIQARTSESVIFIRFVHR